MKAFLQFVIVIILSYSANAIAGVTVKTTSGQVYEDAELKEVEANPLVLIHKAAKKELEKFQAGKESEKTDFAKLK